MVDHGQPKGVIHAGGRDTISRYDLGVKVAEALGLDRALIERVTSARFKGLAPRPPNTTLCINRMENELGMPALSLEQGFAAMRASPLLDAQQAPHANRK